MFAVLGVDPGRVVRIMTDNEGTRPDEDEEEDDIVVDDDSIESIPFISEPVKKKRTRSSK